MGIGWLCDEEKKVKGKEFYLKNKLHSFGAVNFY
jgi:hypothetical protein